LVDAQSALDALPDKNLRDQAAKEIGPSTLQVGGGDRALVVVWVGRSLGVQVVFLCCLALV